MQTHQDPARDPQDGSSRQPGYDHPHAIGGTVISLEEARQRVALFRKTYMDAVPASPEVIRANYFSREAIMKVLGQPGCAGIRIFHSVNPNGTDPITGETGPVRELILVGTDRDRNDLLTTEDYPHGTGCNLLRAFIELPAMPKVADATLVADPAPCPNLCGKRNALS